jgi:hypothetical protein
MFTDRDAQAKGNVLLAISGAFAALSIGFIPVTYEAGRRLRQERRQSSARSLP